MNLRVAVIQLMKCLSLWGYKPKVTEPTGTVLLTKKENQAAQYVYIAAQPAPQGTLIVSSLSALQK